MKVIEALYFSRVRDASVAQVIAVLDDNINEIDWVNDWLKNSFPPARPDIIKTYNFVDTVFSLENYAYIVQSNGANGFIKQ